MFDLCCMYFTNARIYATVAKTSAAATTVAGTTNPPVSGTTCPKCGTNKGGKRSCCARGGAWFQNCGEPGDSNFEHTYAEGIQSCQSELAYNEMRMPGHVRERWSLLCAFYQCPHIRNSSQDLSSSRHDCCWYSQSSCLGYHVSQVRHQQGRQTLLLRSRRCLVSKLWNTRRLEV